MKTTNSNANIQIRTSSILQDLRLVSLFKELSDLELALIGEECQSVDFQPGAEILTQGKPADFVYFIKEGTVDVLVNDDRVAQRGAMDSLGEMSCLSGEEKASATVRAITKCDMWRIDRDAFLNVFGAIPTLRKKMFSLLSGRLKQISHRFSEILKHVPHGIVKIDLNGVITDEFSSRCVDYLGISKLAGIQLGDVLFSDDKLMRTQWISSLRQIKSRNSETDKNKIKLPSEISYFHPDGEPKVFHLFYNFAVDETGTVTGLDIGLDDITQKRLFQTERDTYQNMVTQIEQLLVMFEAETGIIVQETISHSMVGQHHFPNWGDLKGKNIRHTLLLGQHPDQLSHFDRWIAMLTDEYMVKAIAADELKELAPTFVFESTQGEVVELSFLIKWIDGKLKPEILGQLDFVEQKVDEKAPAFSTIELMDEIMNAEAKHESAVYDALTESQSSLDMARTLISTPSDVAKNHTRLKNIFHSIKGICQSFGLDTISSVAHELEDVLSDLLQSGQNPQLYRLLSDTLKSLFSLIVIGKSLSESDDAADYGTIRIRAPEIRIRETEYHSMRQLLDQATNDISQQPSLSHESLKEFKKRFTLINQSDLSCVFKRLNRIAHDSAKLLNKKADLEIKYFTPVFLPVKVNHVLSSCLIQIVKNAVYHGIETVSDREFLGKDPIAQITISITPNKSMLTISAQDNGRGVNIEKAAKRAVKLNLIDARTVRTLLRNKTIEPIVNCIWAPGFSTSESISMLSGRGAGMSMIKSEIETLGGIVWIETEPGQGTTVSMRIPFEQTKVEVDPILASHHEPDF